MGRIKNKTLYPLQNPIKLKDHWIGSDGDTGITKNFSGEDTVNLITNYLGLDNSITGLVSIGNVATAGNQVTLSDVVWRVEGEEFTVATHIQNINAAAPGFYRIDIFIGNASGGILKRQGTPSQTNPAQPIVTINEVLLAVVTVFGSEISTEIPPSSDIMLKSEEAQFIINNENTFTSLWGEDNTYRWIGLSESKMEGMTTDMNTSGYLYDGRNLTIINAGSATLQLVHLADSPIPFYCTPLLTLEPLEIGEAAVFKYSSTSGRLEMIGRTPTRVTRFLQFVWLSKGYQEVEGIKIPNTNLGVYEIGDFFRITASDGKFYECLRYKGGGVNNLSSYEGTYSGRFIPLPGETGYTP